MLFLLYTQCYKSSKDQTPLLDISLLGCSVVYKEKQTKRKEHKLKITPFGGEAIVLGLQSKDQAEQWLKVRDFTFHPYRCYLSLVCAVHNRHLHPHSVFIR